VHFDRTCERSHFVDSDFDPPSSIVIATKHIGKEEEAMKVVVVAVAAVAAMSLVAGSACEVNAEGYTNSHKRYAKRHYHRYVARDHSYKQAYPDEYGWFPHDANQLKVGSALWWEQMQRENRLNPGGGKH
jgi:hypothetical protein